MRTGSSSESHVTLMYVISIKVYLNTYLILKYSLIMSVS